MNDSNDLNSKTDYLQRPDFQHHKFLLYGRDALNLFIDFQVILRENFFDLIRILFKNM